jgi:hypothetical protein
VAAAIGFVVVVTRTVRRRKTATSPGHEYA